MENCYCSVQFQTGEELDEALLKAKTACDEADKAVAAKEAIENMVVDSVVLPAGATPTVEKTTENGSVKLTFGLPPGEAGFSPTVELLEIMASNGGRNATMVTITDAEGAQSFTVYDGARGAAGTPGVPGSELTSIERISGTGASGTVDLYTVMQKTYSQSAPNAPFNSITLPLGTFSVTNGKDGFSPTVETMRVEAPIGGTSYTMVTITDANGTQSFNVYDGETGSGGINAPPAQDGVDGVSVTNATIVENGHLILLLSDGQTIDCGIARGEDGESTIASRHTATLTTDGWSAGSGYAYQQTVSLSGVTADTDFDVDVNLSGTDADADLLILEAFGFAPFADSVSGGIKFGCPTTKPSVNIPIIIRTYA